MANIRDVAKKAGVSVTTVSRVLNQHPYVAEEKRLAVEQAMEELGYYQNINAIHLAKGKTRLMGVVVPFINKPYFSTMMNGIADEALRHGYDLVFYQTNYAEEEERKALEALKHKQIDGLIILSRASQWETIEAYNKYGPISVSESSSQTTIPCVSIDHYKAFQRGMMHFIQNGYSKIGYCIARRTGTNSTLRHQAYQDALTTIQQTCREEWIFEDCLTLEDGKRVFEEYMLLPEKPEALLVTSDQVAAGIVMEARKRGIQVPGDLALIGFDNHPIAEALDLTTIELPLYQVGTALVKNVLEPEPSSKVYPFHFVERGSV